MLIINSMLLTLDVLEIMHKIQSKKLNDISILECINFEKTCMAGDLPPLKAISIKSCQNHMALNI